MENINNPLGCVSQSSQVGGFFDTLEAVKEQVEFECFEPSCQSVAENICRIIADVYQLTPNRIVVFNGENCIVPERIAIGRVKYDVSRVQEVYSLLTHEHILLVMDNLSHIHYEIKSPKTYLRTALYNSVLELDVHWENKVNATLPQQAAPSPARLIT